MGSLVTALQKIQSQFGYLKREALEQYSEQTGVPLYRLHSVASFFPHFQLTPPKPVTLKICRDMACHMAGSGQILRDVKERLLHDFRIDHTTIQFEHAVCEVAHGCVIPVSESVEHHHSHEH